MGATVSDLIATTLRNRKRAVADQITNHNALLARLKRNKRLREVANGGRTLFEPLLTGTNSSVQFFSGYDEFNPPGADQETVDAAEYNWKQLGGFASISGLEEIQNSDKHAAVDLAEARINQLEANIANSMATSLYSNGTGSGSKEFGGLQLLIADDPTAAGTVGGINQVTQTFWQNQYSAAAATTAATITHRMNLMDLAVMRGTDQVDLILADNDMYLYYLESLQSIQRISSAEMAEAGFNSVKFRNADVVYDSACPNLHMYFVNTKYIGFRYAPGHWFDVEEPRKVINANYKVTPMWVAGNLTCNNRARQGVIIGS